MNILFIMESINQQIGAFLKKQPSQAEITDYFNHFQPKVVPKVFFHMINPKSLSQPTLVYARLMIQDIRDSYYYYSFVGKKPISDASQHWVFKWGNNPENSVEQIEDDSYLKVMTQREPVVCTGVIGMTSWGKELEGTSDTIVLIVDDKIDFKLGEIINVVAFYYPDHNKLYFVRKVQENQIIEAKLAPIKELEKEELNFSQVRQQILNYFSGYCSGHFAEYLLLSLISKENMFIGAEADISKLVETVYPRVSHVQLKYPCEDSLFPYKNQEGELIQTPMQMSNLPTFISLDFSQFSSEKQVKISDKAIDNIKALKVFVEQVKTIYRWQYGESLVDHKHKGIIVKASSFLEPHFFPLDQRISPDFQSLKAYPKELLQKFRAYFAAITRFDPVLSQEERAKIQLILKEEKQKQKLTRQLKHIMQLSKLIAMSHGRDDITLQDFNNGQILIEKSKVIQIQ